MTNVEATQGSCQTVLHGWGDEIEEAILKRNTDDWKELSKQICGTGLKADSLTRACYGVYRSQHTIPKEGDRNYTKPYPYHF